MRSLAHLATHAVVEDELTEDGSPDQAGEQHPLLYLSKSMLDACPDPNRAWETLATTART